jgi:hypothetical protein
VAFLTLPIRGFLFTLTDSPYGVVAIQLLDGVAAGIFGVISIIIAADLCLEEIFISQLFEAKANVDPADWWEKWRAVKLFQRPAEMVHPVRGSVAASRVLAGTTGAPSGAS